MSQKSVRDIWTRQKLCHLHCVITLIKLAFSLVTTAPIHTGPS